MSVKVKIGGDSKGAEDALKKTRTGMQGLGAEGKKSGDSIAGGFIKAQIALSAASIAAKALGSAFSAVAVGAIRVGADMESFEVKLETLLGSSAAAEERLAKLFEIGSTTPFQLDQLVAAEVKLEAFGVTGDRARTAVMDLAAFMDGDLAGAADAVGRAFAGGAGAADILRDRGVLAMVELQAGIKPTELSLEEFRETLIDTLTDPNGKIAGGTEKLAKTFEGLVSNLQDEWFKFQKSIADASAFTAAKAGVAGLLVLIENSRGESEALATVIGENIGGSIQAVALGAAVLLDTFQSVKREIDGVLDNPLIEALGGLDLGGAFLGLLGPAGETLDLILDINEATGATSAAMEALGEIGSNNLNAQFVGPVLSNVDQIRQLFEQMKGDAAGVAEETEKTTRNLEGAGQAAGKIGKSPLFDLSDVKRLTREIEKMAGVFDEEAAIAEERKELQEQINALLAQKLISENDAFRLESLLLISAGDRLDLEKELSAEKELQNRLAQEAADAEARRINNIGQGTQALSQGAGSFISSGVGAAGAWGALIMAAIGAAQRDEEGNLALITQNDEFQAEVQAFAANIGDLIIEATEQVPEHLAEAMTNWGPEIVENLILGLTEAGPELAPALMEAIIEGLSDPMHGVEIAGMLIQLIVSAIRDVPEALGVAIEDAMRELVTDMLGYFTSLWGDGFRNALLTFGEDVVDIFVDIIENLTGLDIDGSEKESSGRDRERDQAGNRAGRTVSSSSATDSGQGQNVVVELIQNFDAERFGLAVDISQIAVVRRGQAVASRVNRAVGVITSATAGGA
jgi:hypothetical protein